VQGELNAIKKGRRGRLSLATQPFGVPMSAQALPPSFSAPRFPSIGSNISFSDKPESI
jgi:hypothetical protein